MFTKSKLSFKNKAIFEKEFKPTIEKCFCIVSRMLFNNRINVDGSIDIENAGFLKKYQLWSYIYYLYYFNNSSVEEFVRMKNKENNKANASQFYDVVKSIIQNQFINSDDIVSFDVNSLVYFINIMIHRYKDNLRNPVIDYLRQILSNKEAVAKLSNFTLVTGENNKNVTLVTNPQNVQNANIKVKFSYT